MESADTGSNKQKITPLKPSDRKLCDGNVVLFRRKGSMRWQARIRRSTVSVWRITSIPASAESS